MRKILISTLATIVVKVVSGLLLHWTTKEPVSVEPIQYCWLSAAAADQPQSALGDRQ